MKSWEMIALEGEDRDYVLSSEQAVTFYLDEENQPEHAAVTFKRFIHNCDGYSPWEVVTVEDRELNEVELTIIKQKIERFDKTYGYGLLPVFELQLTLQKMI